jgi:hypothetical protein
MPAATNSFGVSAGIERVSPWRFRKYLMAISMDVMWWMSLEGLQVTGMKCPSKTLLGYSTLVAHRIDG